MTSGFDPKRDIGAVDAIDKRVAAGRALHRLYRRAGQKSKLHQPLGEILRQIQAIDNGPLVPLEIRERPIVLDTHLQTTVYRQRD